MSDPSNSESEGRGSAEDFAHHHDYSALMLGARRKAAPHIGAPAITRHLGFWIPDKLTLERDEWIEHIEASFVGLYRQLTKLTEKVSEVSTSNEQMRDDDTKSRLYLIHRSFPVEENDREAECIKGAKEQPTRHQRFLLSFIWQSMPVDLTLELFDEYFTLSTIIDLSRCAVASSTKLGKAIEAFNGLAFKYYNGIGDSDDTAANAPRESEFAGAFDVIYNTVWDCLHKDIFAAPFTAHSETLGNVFAEFRGFVACRGGSEFIAPDGKVEPRLENEIGNERFDGNNAIRCVGAIRPFMAADAWSKRNEDDKRRTKYLEPREFTFTPVLDERYIYTSALGAPPFHLRDRHTRLTYMLLAANHCPSELGLLVDGFHVLGTTRLAALYDFPHVTHAALELRELERDISELVSGIMQGKTAEQQLAQQLPGFFGRLTEIEQGIKSEDEDKQPQILGGLSFRVERSRYYQRQFRGLVKGLRIGRIQGFLTYDEAVARRLGGIYDLINTVGLRHERLREILNVLGRRVQTNRTHELQQSINKATARILELHDQIKKQSEASTNLLQQIKELENQVKDQSDKSAKLLGQIKEFQRVGEIGFWAFLFPYYFSSVAIHVVDTIYDMTDKTKHLKTPSEMALGILLLSIVIGTSRALRTYYRPKDQALPEQPKTGSSAGPTFEGGLP
jgi:hypothetical protein